MRRSAVQSLPMLLRCVVLAAQKQMGPDASYISDMLKYMWEPLMAELTREPAPDLLAVMVESAGEMVDLVDRAMITPAMVETVHKALKVRG